MPRKLRKVLLPADFTTLPKALKNGNSEDMDSTRSVASGSNLGDDDSLIDLMEELNVVRMPKRNKRKYTDMIQSPTDSALVSPESTPRRMAFLPLKKTESLNKKAPQNSKVVD